MAKEKAVPKERNKDKSMQKLLDAVGSVLRTEGYPGLKVNNIAATANLDKKLIYRYFGNTEGLLNAYIRSQDFWSNVKSDEEDDPRLDGGKKFTEKMLLKQLEYVSQNTELQKIILWRLSEEKEALKKLTDAQEANGEMLFKGITDPHFKEKATDFRAITAILISGIYYLNLYAEVNGSVFCGIDLKTAEGNAKIQQALSFLIGETYKNL